MHKDIVFDYPEGAEKLGASPRCLVQGMYRKGRYISVQGHPEWHEGVVTPLIEERAASGVIPKETAEDAMRRKDLRNDGLSVVGRVLWTMLGVPAGKETTAIIEGGGLKMPQALQAQREFTRL